MSLSSVLDKVLAIKGVSAAAVANPAGSIVASASHHEDDIAMMAGLVTSGLASSQVFAKLLGEGEVEQAMIEYENGPVLLTPLEDDAGHVSVIALETTSALGRVRLHLRKLLPELSQTVDA